MFTVGQRIKASKDLMESDLYGQVSDPEVGDYLYVPQGCPGTVIEYGVYERAFLVEFDYEGMVYNANNVFYVDNTDVEAIASL